MRKSRFTGEQVIAILAEQGHGAPTAEVCRRHAISDAALYKWKASSGGMAVSDARRLRRLEGENARLKRLAGRPDARRRGAEGPGSGRS